LNLSVAFGDNIAKAATEYGAQQYNKQNIVYALGIGIGGFTTNIIYPIFLFIKNGTFPLTFEESRNVYLPLQWGLSHKSTNNIFHFF